MKDRTYLPRPSSTNVQKRGAFVDNCEFVTNKAFDVWNVGAVLIGQFLGNLVGSISMIPEHGRPRDFDWTAVSSAGKASENLE